MASFGVAWGVGIDQNVLGVTGRLSKKVEDSDSVAAVCPGERIANHPNFSQIRYSRQSRKLRGIVDPVVP